MSEQEVLDVAQADPQPDREDRVTERTSMVQHTVSGSLLALLAFALAGTIIGCRTLARTMLAHILLPPPSLDFQYAGEGQPISRLLDWNQVQIDGLLTLRELNGVPLFCATATLYAVLFVITVRLLNPEFRLFRVTPSKGGSAAAVAPTALNSAIQPDGLIQAVQILALVGLPVALFWLLTNRWDAPFAGTLFSTGDSGRWGWIWAIRLPLLFAALWIGFARQGLAGTGPRGLNVVPAQWPRLAATGACFGLVTMLIGRFAVPGALEPTLLRAHTLGAFNLNSWREIGGIYLVCMVAAWTAAAALLCVFAGTPRSIARPMIAVVALGVLVVWFAQMPLRRHHEETRLDMTPAVLRTIAVPYTPDHSGSGAPDGSQAAALLAPRLGLMSLPEPGMNANSGSTAPERPIVLFRDDSDTMTGRIGTQSVPITIIQNGYTTDGLPCTLEAEARAVRFLREREYRSALTWTATKYRYESAAHRFDVPGMLTACLDDLSYGPHPVSRNPLYRGFRSAGLQVTDTVQALLCICATTTQNRALLDRWGNLNRFAFPDRQSQRLIGDLYRRFGDVADALAWYRRAEMPRTFMTRIRAEQPLFHNGHITGVLRLNGRPLAGVQVGMMPGLMNGLPHGLEGLVNGAIFEIVAQQPGWHGFAAFHPVPNAFHWLSASAITDARGAFAIDGLTEGQYTVMCTLPADVHLTPPMDPKLHISNPPLPFNVHYGNPSVDLGLIDITVGK
jgi:hypothetical protein